MYKLTYESDEDPSKDGGESEQKMKRESEPDIYHGSEKSRIQQHRNSYPEYGDRNMDERERSVTVKSATEAAFGISSKDKKTEPKTKKSFYSLFRDNSIDNFPTKKSSTFNFASCCKMLLLILYLLALTAGILILFFSVRRLSKENYVLQQRLTSLEIQAGNAASGQSPQVFPVDNDENNYPKTLKQIMKPSSNQLLPIPDDVFIDSPPSMVPSKHSSSCCNLLKKTMMELKLQVSASTQSHSAIQIRLNNAEKKIDMLSDAEKTVQLSLLKIQSKVEDSVGKSIQAIDEIESAALSNKDQKQKTEKMVAFSVSRVTDGVLTDTHGTESFDISTVNILNYENEVVDVGNNINPTRGVFVVPVDGVYVFQLSFCTDKDSGKATTVALMQNKQALRSFRVPLLSASSETYSFDFKTPPLSISQKRVKTGSASPDIRQHIYSAVAQLKTNDRIMLKVTSGAIVELRNKNGEESQFCTKFSGFKI